MIQRVESEVSYTVNASTTTHLASINEQAEGAYAAFVSNATRPVGAPRSLISGFPLSLAGQMGDMLAEAEPECDAAACHMTAEFVANGTIDDTLALSCVRGGFRSQAAAKRAQTMCYANQRSVTAALKQSIIETVTPVNISH